MAVWQSPPTYLTDGFFIAQLRKRPRVTEEEMLAQVRKKIMEISLLTDIGQKRSNNQDFVNKFVNQAGVTLVVVADRNGWTPSWNIANENVSNGPWS